METFTGRRMKQFERLLKVVRERGGGGPHIGRPWWLPLAGRVLRLVAVYYRTNFTMRELAPLFRVSPIMVCRVIRRLRPLLVLEQAARPIDAADRLWIVDGTLVPVRDCKVGASSRNYRFSANMQVIIDGDTRLGGRRAPGAGQQGRRSCVARLGPSAALPGRTVLGDGAYINTGLVVPHRNRPGRPCWPTRKPITRSIAGSVRGSSMRSAG